MKGHLDYAPWLGYYNDRPAGDHIGNVVLEHLAEPARPFTVALGPHGDEPVSWCSAR